MCSLVWFFALVFGQRRISRRRAYLEASELAFVQWTLTWTQAVSDLHWRVSRCKGSLFETSKSPPRLHHCSGPLILPSTLSRSVEARATPYREAGAREAKRCAIVLFPSTPGHAKRNVVLCRPLPRDTSQWSHALSRGIGTKTRAELSMRLPTGARLDCDGLQLSARSGAEKCRGEGPLTRCRRRTR
jgi:hypothetical protein